MTKSQGGQKCKWGQDRHTTEIAVRNTKGKYGGLPRSENELQKAQRAPIGAIGVFMVTKKRGGKN